MCKHQANNITPSITGGERHWKRKRSKTFLDRCAIVNQANTGTVFKATQGKLLRQMRCSAVWWSTYMGFPERILN